MVVPENFALTVLEQNIIFCGKKVPKLFCEQKMKKYILDEFCSKYRNEKKHFFGKKIPNCISAQLFCSFEKTAEVFLPKNRQKMLALQDKKRRTKRKQERCLPYFDCTFENTVENFSAEASNSSAHSAGKNLYLCERKIRKWPLHTKNDECRLLSENFAQSMEVSRSKYLIKKCFSRKKLPSCSFANVFCSFEIIPFFSLNLPETKCSESEKKDHFSGKKTTRTFLCTY